MGHPVHHSRDLFFATPNLTSLPFFINLQMALTLDATGELLQIFVKRQ